MRNTHTKGPFLTGTKMVILSLVVVFFASHSDLAYKKHMDTKNYSWRRASSAPITRTTSASSNKTLPVSSPTPTGPSTNTTLASASCTTGWYITGYFTPVETDYTGAIQSVTIKGVTQSYNTAFLKEVQTEGWGKTKQGNYIGWYDNSWHLSSQALDAYDKPLTSHTVAVDPSLIGSGQHITIPTLLGTFGTMTFDTSDVGPDIIGKHIDVFNGEGKVAEALTYKITGRNNTVCVLLLP